jgi:hypothetical protein
MCKLYRYATLVNHFSYYLIFFLAQDWMLLLLLAPCICCSSWKHDYL